tara:strand:- start:15 stop:467 length:453 start_codon:yes stop_codon:yes gene_type:complete
MNYENLWVINKKVLPQYTDHAGVLWHGAYLNWLEEARIDALSKVGLKYTELINEGFEMPVIDIKIKYKFAIRLDEEINIKSKFEVNRGPKIKVISFFFKNNDNYQTKAEIDLILVKSNKFTIVRRRPQFIDIYLRMLEKGPSSLQNEKCL